VGRVAITEVELRGMPPTSNQMLHSSAICQHAGFAVFDQPDHEKPKTPTSRRNDMLRIVQYLVKKKKTLR
jgi:hypothetical protein